MNSHRDLHAHLYATTQSDLIRKWVSESEWSHGLTIQPSNPRYTADDIEMLGSDIIHALGKMLGIRRGLWICFVREQSRGEGLWHLHGLMRLESNKRMKWMHRHGEDRILECCDRFAERRGSRHSDPSIHFFTETSKSSDRWLSYINKEAFKDPNGERFIFGPSH